MKVALFILTLQVCSVASSRIKQAAKRHVSSDLSEVEDVKAEDTQQNSKAWNQRFWKQVEGALQKANASAQGGKPPKCGHLPGLDPMSKACYPVKSDRKGKAPCEGKCAYVPAEWNFGFTGSCQCNDESQKCKSAYSKNPGLEYFSVMGLSAYTAVKVDPETKEWSYLQLNVEGSSNVVYDSPVWVHLGHASSLDPSEVLVPGSSDISFVLKTDHHFEDFDKPEFKDANGNFDPCNERVMAVYVRGLKRAR